MSAAEDGTGLLVPRDTARLYRRSALVPSAPPARPGGRAASLERLLSVPRWPFAAVVAVLVVSVAAGTLVRVPVRVPLTPTGAGPGGISAVAPPGAEVAPGLAATVVSGSREAAGVVSGVHRESVPGTGEAVTVVTVEVRDAPPDGLGGVRVLVETGTRPLLAEILGQGMGRVP
ncbi:hypothetical protein ABZ512_06825 [Nocardiopsis dassonvillei]|uniref:hypothetical protein n=1 Tax=Nocardiopsis dassonvillei TaxID=2014 RepID=UPI003406BC98